MDVILQTMLAAAMALSGNASTRNAAVEVATDLVQQCRDACSADSNIRMEQLLYSSPELKQIREEWRKFWFTDMPSHLVPQRVHGGITP